GVLSLGLSRADLSITHASTGVVPVTRSRRPTAGGQDERPRSRDKRSGPLLQKGFAVGEAFSRCGAGWGRTARDPQLAGVRRHTRLGECSAGYLLTSPAAGRAEKCFEL